MSPTQGIDYFYRHHPLTRWQVKASLKVRRRIYDWFVEKTGGVRGKAVLDHGSTPDTERGDSNCFIKWLLADGASVYATSPEDIRPLESIYPGVRVLLWPPVPEQFAQVDLIISSAVLEHVGPYPRQIEYLAGLLRFRRPFLVATPNRGHWLEFHTKLPLCHWLPGKWHRRALALLGLRFWAKEENLSLLSRGRLADALQAAAQSVNLEIATTWYSPKFLGMTSNLVVLVEPRKPGPRA